MAGRQGYDVVVDVDAEGDLGHTDLNDDLEFHDSTFDQPTSNNRNKPLPPNQQSPFLNQPPSSRGGGGGGPQSSSRRYLWSLAFYQQFFDVDTSAILLRCRAALFPRQNFLDVLDGNPDLYGPFWIATTVVFILFMTGTISAYLAQQGKGHFAYDFELLGGAAGLVYGYTLVIPLGLWAVLRWFGSESANLMECWALYGYGNLIWIPVALASWSQLNSTDAKTSRILLVVVIALHAGLAIAIKILFFAHQSPAAKSGQSTGGAPDPLGDSERAGQAMAMLLGL
ncbi:hypothetical protein LTR02_013185 [Friedmanniomyces endolithicus]|nr:hypothetical protein LTR59_014096 [Friedmanniomyces endolithicus]KAK0790937.1 hypothetical protein LTR75_011902 [Friedmanniomyces endolithicus]KAK0869906.1 hypothetical protein LTR87_013513 [Friedmanniomyces endolithicus]KAK0892850.1 hypothetical protein LTR02_013185 [Friedmanniomyces endolithicus]KAK0898910.1 hypothetical protein LTR57_021386 [Friedmanniomyces endolithicus]